MDFPTPDGSTGTFSLSKGALAIWIVAGFVALIIVLLLLDAMLSRSRVRALTNPSAKRFRFLYLKKFLAWLFYPSFQRYFEDHD